MLGYYSQAGVGWLLLIIAYVTFAVKIWALVDAALRRAPLYVAAGKQSKTFWLAVLGVAVLVNLVVPMPINLLNVVGLIAALVYLVDVRPALQQLGGGGRGGGRGGFGRRDPGW